MVAYLIIPRLYLAQEVAHSANFSNGCSSSSLRYSSLPKLFDLFLLILLPPFSPLSLSLSQSSFFFDFLRLDTWKVFIHRFEPIHLLFVSSEQLSENFPFCALLRLLLLLCILHTLKILLIFLKDKMSNVFSTIGGSQLLMHPFRTGKDRVNVIVLRALRLITANCPFKWKTFGKGGGHPCRLNHPRIAYKENLVERGDLWAAGRGSGIAMA